MNPSREKLVSLKHSDFIVSDPSEDIRGRKVMDRDANEIGKIDDLFMDEAEKKIRFIEVSSGGLLGLGDTRFLLPVDAITAIEEDHVDVDQTRETISGAPTYDPAITDQRYIQEMYDYYEYAPYWGPGYVYPPYPHYAPPRTKPPRSRRTA